MVCGPSGSGKSTMIRCINRLEAHDAGTITVRQHRAQPEHQNINAIRREVAMVFQQLIYFRILTVVENLTLGRSAPAR